MKGKVFLIFFCAAIVFGAGTSIAYYNTKSLGFDENAKIVSTDNEKFTIMDFDFYYKDINEFYNKLESFLPEKSYSIALLPHYSVATYNVYKYI